MAAANTIAALLTLGAIYADPLQNAMRKDQPMFCLSANVYLEADNQSFTGKTAVAHVTKNRAKDPDWGTTYCDVVHERLQFSWTIPTKLRALRFNKKPSSQGQSAEQQQSWGESVAAAILVDGGQIPDPTHGATYFCNPKVSKQAWCHNTRYVATIEDHRFFLKKDVDAYFKSIRKRKKVPK